MYVLCSLQMNKSAFPKIEENKDNKTESTERSRAAVVFSLKNEVGGLVKALKLFQVWRKLLSFWALIDFFIFYYLHCVVCN